LSAAAALAMKLQQQQHQLRTLEEGGAAGIEGAIEGVWAWID
tara:strand:- start:86 stop:211 length:126 start_codon:yes stop_codon:yes gene_type:complete